MTASSNTAETYTQAKFYKCALQVNPASYINYRGKPQPLSEAEYNQKLLAACLDADIAVVGIADHGNVDGVDAIRELLSDNGIVVFPGFEIASSEKIHFVCLFDETTTSQKLERYLGKLDLLEPTEGVRPSSLSAELLIRQVEQWGGFIYAAHCTGDHGLLKAKQDHIWCLPLLRAAQIPGSVEDLKGFENDFYRKVFRNKDQAYKRARPMVAINAKDVEAPDTIRESAASCLIKMTQPGFAAFKQAFLDPQSRIRLNSELPENPASAIESIRFVGGYLDDVKIDLSDHLNTLIGGRGTGKSTVLECIRFALDLEPFGLNAKKQHSEIIKENLGQEKGLVELIIRSGAMNSRRFTVLRKYGEQPVVIDESGKLSPYAADELLPQLEIFGQNEIYEMTRNDDGKRHLLKRFLSSEYSEFATVIKQIRIKLKANREAIIRAYDLRHEIEAAIERLPKLQDQVKQFQSLGIEEKLKAVPALEKEKQLDQRITAEIDELKTAIQTVKDSLPDSAFLAEPAITNLPHATLLSQQRTLLEKLTLDANALLKQFDQIITSVTDENQVHHQQLVEGVNAQESLLEKAFKEIPASQGKSGKEIGMAYQQLLQQIEQIKPQQITLQQRQQLIDELENKRKLLLSELSETQAHRSAKLLKGVKRINKKLAGKLKLNINVEGNRTPLMRFLMACKLDGVGEKRLLWTTDNDFSPANLSATIRQGIDTLQKQQWDIVPSVANALMKLSQVNLLELEELELPDEINIELNVAHDSNETYRPLEKLSIGQQCTAILHLLLLDNQDPLILDQPEDNLDNAFIADRIVNELRAAKVVRQFLFATHNANIPVFGDAEWIGVLNVVYIVDGKGKGEIPLTQQGAIDRPAIQKLAADILEGGESAFNQRREKYGFE